MLKRWISVALMISLMISMNVYALSAKSAVLIEAQTGRVLMEQDAYTRRPMASTTKIMTALIALEKGNLSDMVTVSYAAQSVEGSSIWLKAGEKLTLENLLYGLMLNSGNDAATAIAEHIGGSVPKFVEMMNEKVREMGLKNTSFDNPHGLDSDKHYTTAYDLAQITREAMKNPKFAEIVATKTKKIPRDDMEWGRSLKNHNRLLFSYEGANGVKTGFTKISGRTLVSAAKRNGIQLIAVTLNASDDWDDHAQMLDYGFSICKNETLVFRGEYIRTIPVEKGMQPYAQIVAKDDLCATLKEGEISSVHVEYSIPDDLKAPVKAGQEIGRATAFINGKEISSTMLITQSDISLIPKKGLLETIKDVFYNIFTIFA